MIHRFPYAIILLMKHFHNKSNKKILLLLLSNSVCPNYLITFFCDFCHPIDCFRMNRILKQKKYTHSRRRITTNKLITQHTAMERQRNKQKIIRIISHSNETHIYTRKSRLKLIKFIYFTARLLFFLVAIDFTVSLPLSFVFFPRFLFWWSDKLFESILILIFFFCTILYQSRHKHINSFFVHIKKLKNFFEHWLVSPFLSHNSFRFKVRLK